MTSAELGLREDEYRTIVALIAASEPVENAVVFGSRAKGTWRPGSDVDIALSGTALCHDDIVALSYTLNEETFLPWHFDLVDYRSIQNPVLKEHIDRVGKPLFMRSGFSGA